MKLQTISVSATIAIVLGLVQGYLLIFCWGYIAANTPLPHWLIGLGLRGAAFRAVLLPIDFLTSVAISIPAALVLIKLRPAKLLIYLVLAVVPSFLWHNVGLVGDPFLSQFFGAIALGWLPELFALPVAAWLLQLILKPGVAPNNSFKPKPLRGSA